MVPRTNLTFLLTDRGVPFSSPAGLGNWFSKRCREAGLRIAPSDAHSELRARADIVTRAHGGGGVLREVADLLIGAREA